MFPELVRLGDIAIHSYGFFIAIGTYLSFLFFSKQLKKNLEIPEEEVVTLFIWLIGAVVVGGKVFFYLEDLNFYVQNPSKILSHFGNGFVFFGSLIFAIPTMLIYFKYKKWPTWQLLDYMAITACIVHSFGRIGCFMAGCCYGIPTSRPWGVIYSNPICAADPLDVPLHPTQLYEVLMIGTIGIILFLFRKYKQFNGQWFFIYLIAYSIGRSLIEEYRGDEARGFLFDGSISHSQFISVVLVLIALLGYYMRFTKKESDLIDK